MVSKLPRLVNFVKTAVEEKRSTERTSFMVYDDLMQLMARRVVPDDGKVCRFVQGNRIRFDCDDSNVSFSRHFVSSLNANERKSMSAMILGPLALWNAIITIKSLAKCAMSKGPLTLEEYLDLPASFGLKRDQRVLCYDLFTKYEQWRLQAHAWDDADRVLFILSMCS